MGVVVGVSVGVVVGVVITQAASHHPKTMWLEPDEHLRRSFQASSDATFQAQISSVQDPGSSGPSWIGYLETGRDRPEWRWLAWLARWLAPGIRPGGVLTITAFDRQSAHI